MENKYSSVEGYFVKNKKNSLVTETATLEKHFSFLVDTTIGSWKFEAVDYSVQPRKSYRT